jgi:hypothetical protein
VRTLAPVVVVDAGGAGVWGGVGLVGVIGFVAQCEYVRVTLARRPLLAFAFSPRLNVFDGSPVRVTGCRRLFPATVWNSLPFTRTVALTQRTWRTGRSAIVSVPLLRQLVAAGSWNACPAGIDRGPRGVAAEALATAVEVPIATTVPATAAAAAIVRANDGRARP